MSEVNSWQLTTKAQNIQVQLESSAPSPIVHVLEYMDSSPTLTLGSVVVSDSHI